MKEKLSEAMPQMNLEAMDMFEILEMLQRTNRDNRG